MKNQKRNISIILFTFLMFVCTAVCFPERAKAASTVNVSISGVLNYDEAKKCLDLVNKERAAVGLKPVVMDSQLQKEAMLRAQECAFYCYHTKPNGNYYQYSTPVGEIITMSTAYAGSSEWAMDNWMNSPGHRAEIIMENNTAVGIGCYEQDGWCYWVQAFYLSYVGGTAGNTGYAGTGKVNSTVSIPVLTSNLNLSFEPSISTKLQEGKSQQLQVRQANVINSMGYDFYASLNASNFTWSSSNAAVASVNGNGVVTARKGGSAVITATLKGTGIKASTTVTVSHTHKYTSKVVSPTATAKGYTLHTCSCGSSYKDNYKNPVKKMTVKLSKTSVTYNGKAQKPKVTVSINGKELASKYYTVSYKNNKKVGTATVTVKGKGSYKGISGTATFKIQKATFKIKLSKTSVTYNGKAQKPKVTVTANGKKLASKYYSVSYKNNKKVGTATVTVKGKGIYKGCNKSATFKIKLKKATISSVKSSKKGKVVVKWKKSSGNTGYQIQYATDSKFKSAKTTTVSGAAKTSVTLSGVKSKKTCYVRVRTYKKVSGKNWYGSWSAVRKVKVK